jgi:hypothetical protein
VLWVCLKGQGIFHPYKCCGGHLSGIGVVVQQWALWAYQKTLVTLCCFAQMLWWQFEWY